MDDTFDLSSSLEDYLEAIYMVFQERKVVRVKDLVKKMNVKTASVIGALRKLEQKGLVEHEHYGYIDLTGKGIRKAYRIYERHLVLYRFLNEFLQVGEKNASNDACMIEHSISQETYSRVIHLMRYLERESEANPSWYEAFRSFMKELPEEEDPDKE